MEPMNIVFDLDGTLADCDHRLHYIVKPGYIKPGNIKAAKQKSRRADNPDWTAYFAACGEDKLIEPVAAIFQAFVEQTERQRSRNKECNTLHIWTARNSVCLDETLPWLEKHLGLIPAGSKMVDQINNYLQVALAVKRFRRYGFPLCVDFRMRLEEDYQPDYELKKRWYLSILNEKYLPNLVFEDRSRVVSMWRELGVQCCQVEQGDF